MKCLSILFVLLIVSCANVVMPTGGAKDSFAPKVVSSYPANNSVNFKGDEISLKFDEFVELESPTKSIMISPFTKQNLEHYILGKKIFLKFPEGLKPNTTYSIQFKRAIKDYTEGNFIEEQNLNFSTGASIDSGKLQLMILDAKSKKPNEFALVTLVKTKSDFFGKNYNYISKTTNGIASFSNLNKDEYYSYAFADSNQNLTWDRNEPVSFLKNKLVEGKSYFPLNLFLNNDSLRPIIVTTSTMNKFDLHSNQEIYTYDSDNDALVLTQTSPNSLSLIIENPAESQKIDLKINGKRTQITLPQISQNKKIDLSENQDNRAGLLKRNDSCFLAFNTIITKLDKSKIKLNLNDKEIPTQITKVKNQILITGLEVGQNYSLILDSQALWSQQNYNKNTSVSFTTYGKELVFEDIVFKIDSSISNKRALIYWKQGQKYTSIITNKEFKVSKVFEVDQIFHIIIDKNNNGVWDTGDIEKELGPEPYHVVPIKLEQAKKEYLIKI